MSKLKSARITKRFVTVSVVSESSLPYGMEILDTQEKAEAFWDKFIAAEADYEASKERLVVVLLNTRLAPYAWHVVSVGSVSETTAHPREILRPVLAGAASSFLLMHNHPSGDPTPSRADETVTRRIVEAAILLQVRLTDHIIVGSKTPGRPSYYSFRDAGLIA